MAQYDYKCSDGHIYTETRGMTEDQKQKECPQCGKDLVRIYAGAAPSIQFKGSGFYSSGG